MLRYGVLLAWLTIITGTVNINFGGMFSGSGVLPALPPTSTCAPCPTCAPKNRSLADQPYLSLRLALDAGAVRVASKGLWNRFWVTENVDWPGIAFDPSCAPLPSRFPFPPKTGAFASLLAKGLVAGFSTQRFANFNGDTNPPTGNTPDYINAVINELKAEYGQFSFTWKPYSPEQFVSDGLFKKEIDFNIGHVLGYTNRSNPVPENRAYLKAASGCPAYIYPGYVSTLAGSKYKDLSTLAAGGSNVRVLDYNAFDSLRAALLPNAVRVDPPNFDYADFTQWLKALVDGTVDILWGANVVAPDVVGTPYKLEQFTYFSRGDMTRMDWVTLIDD